MAIVETIRGIDGKVNSFTPHTISSESHVKTNLTLINLLWISVPSSVPKQLNFRVFSKLIFESLYLSSVTLPQRQVLDNLNPINLSSRPSFVEKLNNAIPCRRTLRCIIKVDISLPVILLVKNVFPVFRNAQILYLGLLGQNKISGLIRFDSLDLQHKSTVNLLLLVQLNLAILFEILEIGLEFYDSFAWKFWWHVNFFHKIFSDCHQYLDFLLSLIDFL